MGYTVTNVKETEGQTISHKKHIRPCEKSLRYILKNFDEECFRIEKTTKKNVTKKKLANDDNLKIKKIKMPSPKTPQEVTLPKEETAHIDNIDKLLNEYKKLTGNEKIWYMDNDIIIIDDNE